MSNVSLGNIEVGKGNPLLLIAGPCSLESEELAWEVAKYLKEITQKFNMPFVFKSSYDKANLKSNRNPGKRVSP